MSESTLEKIEKLIYETSQEFTRSSKEYNRRWEENERRWKENERRWKETERRWQETDRRWEETDRRIEESDKKMKENQSVLNDDWEKYKKEMKAEHKHLSKIVGAIGNKFGSFTEGLMLPSLHEIFLKKFRLEYTHNNSTAQKNGRMIELDAFAFSKKDPNSPVFIAEIKSHLTAKHIGQLKEYMQQFTDFYPEFKGRRIFGLLAGVKVSKETKDEIYKSGLYLAIAGRDQFRLVEYTESFKPFYIE